MNAEQMEAASWMRLHHREMRRYLRMLARAKHDGYGSSSLEGLRGWVRTLRANAQNCIARIRNNED